MNVKIRRRVTVLESKGQTLYRRDYSQEAARVERCSPMTGTLCLPSQPVVDLDYDVRRSADRDKERLNEREAQVLLITLKTGLVLLCSGM